VTKYQPDAEKFPMLATFFDISRYFLSQRKHPMHVSSDVGRTVFWRTPFLDKEQALSLLDQWRAHASSLERLFGDQKRYVFPQLELTLGEKIFIPKIYRVRKLSQNLIALAFAEAERNCATQSYLFDRRILVPMPAGVLNTYKNGWLNESIFFQEKLADSCLAYKKFLPTVLQLDLESRKTFFIQLAHEIAKLHSLGVYTEDTDQNMFVEHMQGSAFRFHFFDFDNFYPWRYPTLRRTAHAIRHYTNSKLYTYTLDELALFLDAYLETRGKTHWREHIMADLRERKPRMFSPRD
jgi:3-deoxy-D-manno-octulosonic acid kinase